MISYLELIDKDIINVKNGENIGRFSDIEIDIKKGKVTALYIEDKNTKLFSFFNKAKSMVINWEEIVKIGLDVIVVNYESDNVRIAKEIANGNWHLKKKFCFQNFFFNYKAFYLILWYNYNSCFYN